METGHYYINLSMTTHLSPSEVTDRTVYLERYRAIAMGIFESYPTFLLMILVRWFHGNGVDKSIVAAASQGGLLFSPILLFLSRQLRWSSPKILSLLVALSSLSFFGAAITSDPLLFVVFTTLGILLPATATPLTTSIFNNNYPASRRGQLFAQNQAIRIGTSVLFGALAGWLLTGRIELYYLLMITFGLSLAAASHLIGQIPGENASTPPAPLFSCFRYLVTDDVLRNTTISWTFLGFGNLMMVPLRVEYLANPTYGLRLSEMEIALFVSVLPNVARLAGTYIWGKLFDTINFFSLRMALNISFMVGIVGFFMTSNWVALAFSALVFGFSTSGGDVAWNLWVTKFAPEERVADYMAVHTFFTGIRGLLAPITAFMLLEVVSIHALSWISAALIIFATLLLIPVRAVARDKGIG